MATDETIESGEKFVKNNNDDEDDDDDDDEKIEHIADLIGPWGPFQKKLYIILSIVYSVSPFSNTSLIFYMIKSDFYCVSQNSTSIFVNTNSSTRCEINLCAKWYHNTTRTTIIKEFDLVCDRSWLAAVSLSSYALGYLVSGLLIGAISDRFGRKMAVIVSLIDEIICFIAIHFSPSITVFVIARFMSGIGGYGRYLATVLLLIESVGPKLRGKMAVYYEWIWHVGFYLMILITYYVESFRDLYLGVAIYQVFLLAVVIVKMPESVRWQLVTGRTKQARETLTTNIKFASVEEEEEFDRKLKKLSLFLSKETHKEAKSIVDIWKVPRLLKYCIALYLFWFVQGFSGYGMGYNTLDLAGNFFINIATIRLSTLVSTAFLCWRIERYNRKTLLFSCNILAAVSLAGSIPLLSNQDRIFVRNMILMIGEFAITTSMQMNYVFTSELFPTTIRHLALGSCSVGSRIGAILAPFVSQLTQVTSIEVTMSVFALATLFAAIVSLVFPETRGREIPDTIMQMIEMNAKKAKNEQPLKQKDNPTMSASSE